jgi:hypothetical protein
MQKRREATWYSGFESVVVVGNDEAGPSSHYASVSVSLLELDSFTTPSARRRATMASEQNGTNGDAHQEPDFAQVRVFK